MGWFGGDGSDSSSDSTGSSYGSDSSFSSFGNSSSSNYSDSMSSDMSGGLDSGLDQLESGGDAELQKFIMQEQQKAQLTVMIHKLNNICWDTCMSAPESKLSSKTETCISNCADRFIDASLFITNRFAQLLSKGGGLA